MKSGARAQRGRVAPARRSDQQEGPVKTRPDQSSHWLRLETKRREHGSLNRHLSTCRTENHGSVLSRSHGPPGPPAQGKEGGLIVGAPRVTTGRGASLCEKRGPFVPASPSPLPVACRRRLHSKKSHPSRPAPRKTSTNQNKTVLHRRARRRDRHDLRRGRRVEAKIERRRPLARREQGPRRPRRLLRRRPRRLCPRLTAGRVRAARVPARPPRRPARDAGRSVGRV